MGGRRRSGDDQDSKVRVVRGEPVPGSVLERPSRREQVGRIEELEAQGLTTQHIAERVGLSPSTINKYRRDPDGQRESARRERYRRACLGCGRATRGSDGPGRGPEYCPACAPAQRRRWSDEQLLSAIREWAKETGAPPTLADWSPAHAPPGHEGARRYLAERGGWPHASSVARRFGSLRAAIERAGLQARPRPGEPAARVANERDTTGTQVESLVPRSRRWWDFSQIADGRVYLLRKGSNFDVEVDSLAVAARHWARERGYTVTMRSQFGEGVKERVKVALYVRFEDARAGRASQGRSVG